LTQSHRSPKIVAACLKKGKTQLEATLKAETKQAIRKYLD